MASNFAELLSLSALAAQPIETRWESLLRCHGDTLSSAVLALHRLNVPVFSNLDTKRVAWAIAYNINPPSTVPLGADVTAHRCSSYSDHFPPETPWSVIWSKLVRVQNESDDGSTLLRELLLSVACEHRQSWQPPQAAPLDRESADLALEFVYTNNRARVVGFVWRNFGARIDDPNAGWKGRGLWSTNGDRARWLQETGKGSKPRAVHIQLRPDPLAH